MRNSSVVLFAVMMAATQLVLLVVTLTVVLNKLQMYSELDKRMELVVVMKTTVMVLSSVAKLVVSKNLTAIVSIFSCKI